MAVRFLSEEYMAAATEVLAEGVDVGDLQMTVQFRVTDPPGGDEPITYYLVFADGTVRMVPGEADGSDVRVTSSYETAAGLAREEIRDQIAFLTGKLKVAGNMARLMANMKTFMDTRRAMQTIDVEY